MPTYPSINDRDFDLWKKIAWNFYEFAVASGVTGLNPPSINDTQDNLQKKVAYYSASVA
jgi:hypothetical protein